MSVVTEISLSFQIADLIVRVVRVARDVREFFKKDSIIDEMNKWERKLRNVEIVLRDAEEQQSKRPGVRLWLQDLQHLAFDVEDVLEDFNHEILRLQMEGKTKSRLTRQIDALLFGRKMSAMSKKITARIDEINDLKEQLNLVAKLLERGDTCQGTVNRSWNIPLVGFMPEPVLCGRKEEENSLVDAILRNNDREIEVIPILGMGGMGKTTLARHVFEIETVKRSFDVRAWFSVSQNYDMMKICNGLLEDITGHPSSLSNVSTILRKLSENLNGKKYLIVLDDLWNDRETDWYALKAALKTGDVGSKIIVTTRKESVANMTRTQENCLALKPMMDEECWMLFCGHAGVDLNGVMGSEKEKVGKEIVRGCGGLPLSAAILGGVLRNKENLEDWRDILAKGSKRNFDIMSVLNLSYNDLSTELKRCFSLFAMFPEDYEFYDEHELVHVWFAEGLIHWNEIKSMYEAIRHYFVEEFALRSLLLRSKGFSMHDMVRDLACEISGKSCCALNSQNTVIERVFESNKTRHLYVYGNENLDSFLKHVKDRIVLRTIMINGLEVIPPIDAMNGFFSKLVYLRTLVLRGWKSELPGSIGNLIHLKVLDLSNSKMRYLPDSVTHLYSLEILCLMDCVNLVELPNDIGNLKKLKELNIFCCQSIIGLPESVIFLSRLEFLYSQCISLMKMPLQIGEMQNLRIIDMSVSGAIKDVAESIGCLSKLEVLNLIGCFNLTKIPSSIGSLLSLKTLNLHGCAKVEALPESISCLTSLEMLDLQQCESLEKIPASLGNLQRLKFLDLGGCEKIEELPESVGQLSSLEMLYVNGCVKLVRVPSYFGNLLNLKTLDLSWCVKIEHLPDSISSLSNLEELDLRGCKSLFKLPSSFESLKSSIKFYFDDFHT